VDDDLESSATGVDRTIVAFPLSVIDVAVHLSRILDRPPDVFDVGHHLFMTTGDVRHSLFR